MQKLNEKLLNAYNQAINFEKDENIIGIQKEKILHKTLKYFVCDDETKHEIKIKKSGKGLLYADVYDGEMIYEIQTRGFNKLRDKLSEFLNEYKVTIVHPVAYKKTIYKIQETGEITGPVKSPKTGKVYDVFKELYKIKFFLNNPNLNLKIILLDMDEYRYVVDKKHSRSSGYVREKQIPKSIYKIYDFKSKNDYLTLLKELNLEEEFTSLDFKKAAKVNKNISSLTLNILTYIEVVERIGKKGNSYIYKLKWN